MLGWKHRRDIFGNPKSLNRRIVTTHVIRMNLIWDRTVHWNVFLVFLCPTNLIKYVFNDGGRGATSEQYQEPKFHVSIIHPQIYCGSSKQMPHKCTVAPWMLPQSISILNKCKYLYSRWSCLVGMVIWPEKIIRQNVQENFF